jgi:hypothetical protein
MERQVSESTLLTYVTTGCLLETLVATKTLEGYTHSKFICFQQCENMLTSNYFLFFSYCR